MFVAGLLLQDGTKLTWFDVHESQVLLHLLLDLSDVELGLLGY